MAKPDHTWIGSSCHIHSSLWSPDGSRSLFPTDDGHGPSPVFNGYLAGLTAYTGELSIFIAPNVNSYKRYAAESWAPTTLAWSHDNRTCGFRVVGHGNGLRIESRIPGADASRSPARRSPRPRHEEKLDAPPMFEGNAYADENPSRVPRPCAKRSTRSSTRRWREAPRRRCRRPLPELRANRAAAI